MGLALGLCIRWISNRVPSVTNPVGLVSASRPPEAGIKRQLFLIWAASPCSKSTLQRKDCVLVPGKIPQPFFPLNPHSHTSHWLPETSPSLIMAFIRVYQAPQVSLGLQALSPLPETTSTPLPLFLSIAGSIF